MHVRRTGNCKSFPEKPVSMRRSRYPEDENNQDGASSVVNWFNIRSVQDPVRILLS